MLVILCKDSDDAYEAVLRAAGHAAVFLPVLSFKFKVDLAREVRPRPLFVLASPHPRLRLINSCYLQRLSEVARFAAVAVTSPRAASVLVEALRGGEAADLVAARACPIYALGGKSYELLAESGLDLCLKGTGASCSADLADALIFGLREATGRPAVLFLCGNKRLDTLPDALKAGGLDFEEVAVYDSVPCESSTIESAWVAAAAGAAVVFFSPSGLETVLTAPSAVAALTSGANAAVAIGETTAAALARAGLRVAATAPSPDPGGVLAAITAVGDCA
jgi:uroporphyrinogen-III synthase